MATLIWSVKAIWFAIRVIREHRRSCLRIDCCLFDTVARWLSRFDGTSHIISYFKRGSSAGTARPKRRTDYCGQAIGGSFEKGLAHVDN